MAGEGVDLAGDDDGLEYRPAPPAALASFSLAPGTVAIAAGATVAVLCAAAASGILVRSDSLAVFDRPADSSTVASPAALSAATRTASVGGVADAVRWLGTGSAGDVYGYLDPGFGVCVAVVDVDLSSSTACATEEAFRATGLYLEAERVSDGQVQNLSVFWGPRGGVRLYELPIRTVFAQRLEAP